MAKPTQKALDKRREERNRKRQAVSKLAQAAGLTPWVEPVRPVPGPHPIVADEFRVVLSEALHGMKDDITGFLHGLKRTIFEPHLARKLGFLSLDRFHVPAGILGMYHFYDFLAESQLVDEAIRQPSQLVCRDLWNDVKKLFQEPLCEWRLYKFLEPYATWKPQ